MKKLGLLLFIMLIMGNIFGQTEGVYELFSDGKPIGTCEFRLEKLPEGFKLISNSTINLAGATSKYESETFLDEGYHPVMYSLEIVMPGGKQLIFAKFESGKANVTAGDELHQAEQSLVFPTNGYILDQHIMGQLIPLGKVINPTAGQYKATVIVPQLMQVGDLTLKNVAEKVVDSKNITRFEGKLGIYDFILEITSENVITYIEYPQQNLVAKLGVLNILDIDPHELLEDYNPITVEMLADKKIMKKILSIKELKGKLTFDPMNNLQRVYLKRLEQSFDGKINPSNIDGELKVGKQSHMITVSGSWPLREPLQCSPEYSKPEPGIESDDPDIKARAMEIVEPAKNLANATRAINLWVNNNIQYAPIRNTAKEALRVETGDSHTKARLTVALLRSIGIPARIVRGILYTDDGPLDHSWVEAFYGSSIAWAPLDPTLKEIDKISARHISIWLGDAEPPVYVNEITLEIEKVK